MSQEQIKNCHEASTCSAQTVDKAGDLQPWYAIRLFSQHLQEVADFFLLHGLETFIPMESVTIEDRDGHLKHLRRPVVRNIIFVKKQLPEAEMRDILSSSAYKMSVYRKAPDSRDFYEISGREMFEFRLMCSQDQQDLKYCSESQGTLKKGTPVIVQYGPLKGLTGKLVRVSKKYYLLKQTPGIAVMLKVTRWCCKPIL